MALSCGGNFHKTIRARFNWILLNSNPELLKFEPWNASRHGIARAGINATTILYSSISALYNVLFVYMSIIVYWQFIRIEFIIEMAIPQILHMSFWQWLCCYVLPAVARECWAWHIMWKLSRRKEETLYSYRLANNVQYTMSSVVWPIALWFHCTRRQQLASL